MSARGNQNKLSVPRLHYPKATSITIIMTKPIISPSVAISVLPLFCDSGISSSTTTKIIAPAAKARAYGMICSMTITRAAPKTAPIGSTIADIAPIKKACQRELPSARMGMESAAPSGIFCNPIPTASPIAPIRAAFVILPNANAPKVTPTAKPSGKIMNRNG